MKQRIIGFAVCSGAGWILSIYAMISFFTLLSGPSTFAVVFALSQILNILGICFLSGPKSQVRGLKKPGRLVATIIFFSSIAMTIISATVIKIDILVVVFLLIEIASYIWYCITMFPFGQKMCKGCLNSLCFKWLNM